MSDTEVLTCVKCDRKFNSGSYLRAVENKDLELTEMKNGKPVMIEYKRLDPKVSKRIVACKVDTSYYCEICSCDLRKEYY